LFWAVFLLISPGIFAQVQRLTPDEAVDLAMKNNLNLEIARIGTETKRQQSAFSWNQFIPSAQLAGTLSRLNEELEPTVISLPGGVSIPMGGGASQWGFNGQLQLQLGLNIAMFKNIKRLKQEYESGLISYEQTRAQIEQNVRRLYYEIVYTQEQLDILKESFTNLQRQAAMAQANYRAGLIPEVDWLRAQVSVENFKPNLDQAESGYKTLVSNYALLLGLPNGAEFALDPIPGEIQFIPLDATDLSARAGAGNWNIQAQRNALLSAESGKWASWYANYTPSLSLGWNYGRTLSDPFNNGWFDGDNWAKGSGTGVSGQLTLSLVFRLDNYLPFSSGARGVKEIDDTVKSLNLNLAQTIRETEINVYTTVFSLEQIRTASEAQRATVRLAERSYQLTEQAYRGGLRQLLDVQSAEQDLRQARLGMLRQNIDYLQGLLDLEYAMGVPFGTLGGRQ
ncbi:MAG: TolC family protein, partial [Treponema sp.]|nr:TolC family protein [Treponema sp.]